MQAIPPIIERSFFFVTSEEDDDDFTVTRSLLLHCVELVITSMSYNPALTLAILDRHDWTQTFFAIWFKNLGKYTRVHDKKIILSAICSLFEWLNGVGSGSPLSANANQLLLGALEVFRDLPKALGGETTFLHSVRCRYICSSVSIRRTGNREREPGSRGGRR